MGDGSSRFKDANVSGDSAVGELCLSIVFAEQAGYIKQCVIASGPENRRLQKIPTTLAGDAIHS